MGRLGVVALIAGFALVVVGARLLRPPADPDAIGWSRPTTPPTTRPTTTTATLERTPPACPTGGVADIDGDGCHDPVAVNGSVVAVGDRRYQVGEPGDIIAVGDWDCDGRATPAALRPSTGEVFLFPSWTDEAITVRAVSRLAGAQRLLVERIAGPCDGLAVELVDGHRAAVWPSGPR